MCGTVRSCVLPIGIRDTVAGRVRLPRVEFVNDALEPYDGEQPGGEPGHPCQEEDGERDQAFPSGRVGQQRLHIDIGVSEFKADFHGPCTVALDEIGRTQMLPGCVHYNGLE